MNDSPYADPRVASVYNRVAAPLQFGLPARDLVRLLRPRGGARVLDVGTGTGAVALHASAEVGPAGVVIGIDASLEMLSFARAAVPHRIALAQIPGLPFPDAVFDLVTAGFVVSHLQEHGLGLAEMARVCRSGGRLGITSWGESPNRAARLWTEIAGRYVSSERFDEAFRARIPWHEWFSRLANVERALLDGDLWQMSPSKPVNIDSSLRRAITWLPARQASRASRCAVPAPRIAGPISRDAWPTLFRAGSVTGSSTSATFTSELEPNASPEAGQGLP